MDRVFKHIAVPCIFGRTLILLSSLIAGPSVVHGVLISDFSLSDVNTTSSSYNQTVSPRNYLRQVSGWYFGSAT